MLQKFKKRKPELLNNDLDLWTDEQLDELAKEFAIESRVVRIPRSRRKRRTVV